MKIMAGMSWIKSNVCACMGAGHGDVYIRHECLTLFHLKIKVLVVITVGMRALLILK